MTDPRVFVSARRELPGATASLRLSRCTHRTFVRRLRLSPDTSASPCPELVEVEIHGNEAIVRYRWLQATGEVPRLACRHDHGLAEGDGAYRQCWAGRACSPRADAAADGPCAPAPPFRVPHRLLGGERCDGVRSRGTRRALHHRKRGAFAHVLAGMEKRLAGGEGFPALVAEVRVAIARQLSEGRPSGIAAVSSRLLISRRTLQRRLSELGTTFQQQLDGVRRTTASRLLATTELDAVAIAMLLGFAEPNSFVRAFRAWEQTTPTRWRERQADSQA